MHAAWLIPTLEFRRAAFDQRRPEEKFWLRTSEPANALERLPERDQIFADVVRSDAQELGLKIIMLDGKRTQANIAEEVAAWFGLYARTD